MDDHKRNIIYKLSDVNGKLSSTKVKYFRKHLSDDEIEYIKNKYDDVITDDDIIECIKCLKYNISKRHKCPICNKYTKFNRHNYNKFCSVKCSRNSKETQYKQKQTTLKKYGVENVMYSDVIKDKMKNTFISKYGVDNPFKSNIIKEKIKQTNLERYGVDCYLKTKDCVLKSHSPTTINKQINTKRKNHTFNSSKQEDECYNILIEKFGSNDIIRQYKSSLYPFACDFYIKSLNLYIECNFHWTHNNHLYNKNNIKDIITKCRWKQKAKTSKYYNIALDVWCKRDVKKFEYAKKNNLNYIIIYKCNDLLNYVEYKMNEIHRTIEAKFLVKRQLAHPLCDE